MLYSLVENHSWQAMATLFKKAAVKGKVRPQGGGGGGIALSIDRNTKLLPRAKAMRRNMTGEECQLWFSDFPIEIYWRNLKE